MLSLLVTLALASSSSCEADTLARFERLRQEAIRQYTVSEAKVGKMSASFGDPGEGADAKVILETGAVTFHTRICGYSDIHRESIVAHEIGHMIDAAVYPAAYTSEDRANYFGAKLITWTEREQLIQGFADRCKAGSKNYCWLESSWSYGFTH